MPTIYVENKSDLPKRKERDFYPTPYEYCYSALNEVFGANFDKKDHRILDPGSGNGVWGNAYYDLFFFDDPHITGIDIKPNLINTSYKRIIGANFLSYNFHGERFKIIMGNPPYNLAEAFLDRSFELLEKRGTIAFLFKLAFLESKKRYDKYYSKNYNPSEIIVSVRRISFTGDKKSNSDAYALYVWDEVDLGNVHTTKLHWLDWNYE